ncbi:hypothetical protein [Desulfotomaculum sp. 1211_IL3151]|uniref:hypothetical protein n=1 Tax=Desulfotomaculum sp. 1211_IL3151 TaxID=3084055 RepID=UPI002FDA13B9
MSTFVDDLQKKRRVFTVLFVAFTAIYGLVFWQGETKLTEHQLQYVVLGWRLSLAALSLWFGYAIGLKQHTVWFVSLLAILPVVSWIGVLYLLFKSGSMLFEAKKAQKGSKAQVTEREKGGKKQGKKRK